MDEFIYVLLVYITSEYTFRQRYWECKFSESGNKPELGKAKTDINDCFYLESISLILIISNFVGFQVMHYLWMNLFRSFFVKYNVYGKLEFANAFRAVAAFIQFSVDSY